MHPNSGKAKALNTGILFGKGQFVITLGADSYLNPNALLWMMDHLVAYPPGGGNRESTGLA